MLTDQKHETLLQYEYFQLKEFVGKDSFHLLDRHSNPVSEQDVRILKLARNMATKQTIVNIDKWKYRDEANSEFSDDKFLDESDYRLMTIQCKAYFNMYKAKAIHSIYYFSNKFVVLMFILSV